MSNMKVGRIRALLDLVLDEDPEFPPRRLQVFLYIADKGPCTGTEIADMLKMYKGNVSDHLRSLAVSMNGKVGLGFITVDFEGSDYKSKYAKLTPSGERFLKRLTEAI